MYKLLRYSIVTYHTWNFIFTYDKRWNRREREWVAGRIKKKINFLLRASTNKLS